MLYNLDKLQLYHTVILTEGEKDANTVTNLGLKDDYGQDIVGTTSGGAKTWNDKLADHLIGHKVIVLSDNDEKGLTYALQVEESLTKRGIEHLSRSHAFTGLKCKDVTEFMQDHSAAELVCLMMTDWIRPLPVDPTVPAPDFWKLTFGDKFEEMIAGNV
jgi:5S rRNA maturation endonuclease (ribonuclease M5)